MSSGSPIPGLAVAGPDDLKELLPLLVVMGYDWSAYLNQRLLAEIKKGALWKRRLTYLVFVPDVENGLLYMVPAQAGDYGAVKLEYSAPETGASLSLYVALLRFELEREQGRQRVFQVEPKKQGNGTVYLALNVLTSKSVPIPKKKSGKGPGEGSGEGSGEGTPAQESAAATEETT